MRKTILLFFILNAINVSSQIQTEHLIGFWCTEKVTSINDETGEERLETLAMEELEGIVVAFNADSSYYLFYHDFDAQLDVSTAEFIYHEDHELIEVIYYAQQGDSTVIEDILEFEVELITENKMILVIYDEALDVFFRNYFYRCEEEE